jgi:hypothetical protein
LTDKKKILDVRMPKKEQEKPEFIDAIKKKNFKWQVTIHDGHKVRYMYGSDPDILQDFAKAKGFKILKVEQLN